MSEKHRGIRYAVSSRDASAGREAPEVEQERAECEEPRHDEPLTRVRAGEMSLRGGDDAKTAANLGEYRERPQKGPSPVRSRDRERDRKETGRSRGGRGRSPFHATRAL